MKRLDAIIRAAIVVALLLTIEATRRSGLVDQLTLVPPSRMLTQLLEMMRGAEFWAVDPAAKLHVFEFSPLDGEREVIDDQPPGAKLGGCQSGHRGIV